MFDKEFILGIDIGSSAIKLAHFVAKSTGLVLVKTGVKEIREVSGVESKKKETITALAEALKEFNLPKSRVIINVNCPQTTIKRITAPYMPRTELREGIKLESKNYFPFPIDEALLDFEIVGEHVEKGVKKYEITVATCPMKTVDSYLAILAGVGLKPSGVVSTSYALQKIAERLSLRDDEVRCFIDIGSHHTELIILRGKKLIFTRKIPVVGEDFTRALTAPLASERGKSELSLAEAEDIKRRVGIPDGIDDNLIEGKIAPGQILSLLRSPLEELINEIERCFAYFREETGQSRIDAVTIFGGGSLLKGLVGHLSESLGTVVKLGDAFTGIKMADGAVSGKDVIAHRVELAVGSVITAGHGINLLPVEIREERKRTFKRWTIEAVVTAVILGAVILYVGMFIQVQTLQKRIDASKSELTSIEPELRKAEAQELANTVLVDEPQWEDVFMELSNIIPQNVHITDFAMDHNVMTIRGVVSDKDGEQVLSKFIISLEKGIFTNVKLIESKALAGKPGVEFELKCWVDYENR